MQAVSPGHRRVAWVTISIPGRCKPAVPTPPSSMDRSSPLPDACRLDSSLGLVQLLLGTAEKTGKEELEMSLGCVPELLWLTTVPEPVFLATLSGAVLSAPHHLIYPPNTVTRLERFGAPLYKGGNWGTERLSNLPSVNQVAEDGVQHSNQTGCKGTGTPALCRE